MLIRIERSQSLLSTQKRHAVDEFGAPTVLIELGELLILRDGDRRDSGISRSAVAALMAGRPADAGAVSICECPAVTLKLAVRRNWMGFSHPIDGRAGAKLALEEPVEKRELIKSVVERDGADGFGGIEQGATDGLEAHLT